MKTFEVIETVPGIREGSAEETTHEIEAGNILEAIGKAVSEGVSLCNITYVNDLFSEV